MLGLMNDGGMRFFRFVPVLALLALVGCGGEEPPYYDGSQSSVLAGARPALAAVGADVVSVELPQAAGAEEVAAALQAEGLEGDVLGVTSDQGLATSPDTIAGVLATVSNLGLGTSTVGRVVVLVFDQPVSAVVFASSDAPVFGDPDLDADRQIYFSGNLVGYYAAEDGVDQGAGLRRALETLAGADQ